MFDEVVDFDAITRDPSSPTRLSSAVDVGDHLHPGVQGYQIMADAIDLALFGGTTEPYCGDGNVDTGETCDDGNGTIPMPVSTSVCPHPVATDFPVRRGGVR